MFWLGIVIGAVIGGLVGFIAAAFLAVGKRGESND